MLVLRFCLVTVLLSLAPTAGAQRRWTAMPLEFTAQGHTVHGDWRADTVVSHDLWSPALDESIAVRLQVSTSHLEGLAAVGIRADRFCLLVTAERTFDADGWLRLPSDERMSTLLTPTGLAIEGGIQGAVTTRYGYQFRTPVDQFQAIAASQAAPGAAGTNVITFSLTPALPADLPPGLYRLRFDLGVMAGTRLYNLNGFSFATRGFADQAGTISYFYSPVIPASGHDVSGRAIDATRIRARIPWLLLSSYNSNGYRGVVADEDRGRFATSDRSLIPDEVILPMFDDNGNRLAYSLEPRFPADTIDPAQNIAWDWTSGALSVRITAPDGTITDLGTAPVQGQSGNGPTTKKVAVTSWKPSAYGRYTVTCTGWINDVHGWRYEGGGTYRFWVAKRMTLATATFQGMPYPVGSMYGRDIQFNPPLAADVQVTATLYVNSDPNDVRTITYSGRATAGGTFGAAQGMKSFPLSAPGEYHAHVLATATDAEGHLWVSTMRHAGVVYPEDSPIVARGKKLSISGKYVDRGETRFEGYVGADGEQHLAHITFPYNAGDVLLIGSEGQGANKVEPVLISEPRGASPAWDTKLNGVGTTNLRIRTSNGYSPHLFPEYISEFQYYYAAAPRPGFMGRFLVGESNVRAPYWPVSPNTFGGQIGASANGDAPGDIYRLLGGVVAGRATDTPLYSGYIASAFLLPKGTNNNRVVAPGAEDLHGPTGTKARFFLVGLRPGSAFEVGSAFRPAVQIDPILPVMIRFEVTYPDGRRQVSTGTGDRFGSYVGATAWTLDVPGVYRYQITGAWNGHEGRMPGLPENGGEFYVYSGHRPAGGLRVDGASHRTFPAASGVTIAGSSTATRVRYALITPGAVIEQGELPVNGGRFQYVLDPGAIHARAPLYDIVNAATGKPQIGRVLHLTFFSEERAAGGSFFDLARVILRGTTLLAPRAAPGAATSETTPVNRPPPVTIAATSLNELRTWDAELLHLVRDGSLRVVSREGDTIVPGRVHERLQQYIGDVPVLGGGVARQLQRDVTISVFGTIHPGALVDTRPAIEASDARALIEQRTGGRVAQDVPAALAVLPLPAGAYTLVWRAQVQTERDRRVCIIDAITGEPLLEYSLVRELRGEWADPPIADVNTAAFRFLQDRFGRTDRLPAVAIDPQAAGATWDGRRVAVSQPRLSATAGALAYALLDTPSRLAAYGEARELGDRFARAFAEAAARGHAEPMDAVIYRAFVYLLPSHATNALLEAAVAQSRRDLTSR